MHPQKHSSSEIASAKPMSLSLVNDQEGLRSHVVEALGREPVDYLAEFDFIDKRRKSRSSWAGGAVLLPVYFREDQDQERNTSGHYVFLLSKRSKSVQQPGDLCAPGGGIHPFLDSLSGWLLRFGLLPGIRGPGFTLAKRKGESVYWKILFLLGNALRESWEELRLSPFNVEFLGPLPTYHLHHRPWIIFPLVGRVKHSWKPKLSWEVDKIVSIPLAAFFDRANYAVYSLEVPENLMAQGIPNPWEFPCLVHKEGGEEEVLWGATFEIIQTFFKIVFGFSFPVPEKGRVVRKLLPSNYISGREGRSDR
ncbi:MAG TPA: CoA pyrophosphatase [Thermodesulfobacteriota bacterium]|nr:CoA pyrophosphatase [Thermodesulfobacteriota bacterium]